VAYKQLGPATDVLLAHIVDSLIAVLPQHPTAPATKSGS